MASTEFIDDDATYLDWILGNSGGFVVNTTKRENPGYSVLHTASCPYVSELRGNAQAGGFTERSYKKIVASSVAELRQWLFTRFGEDSDFSQECGRCKPWTQDGYTALPGAENYLSLKDVGILYDKYMELIKFEVQQLGVKATEARHLIGRLGEFYCAQVINGKIEHVKRSISGKRDSSQNRTRKFIGLVNSPLILTLGKRNI